MFKKIVSLVMVAALSFSLVACGAAKDTGNTEASNTAAAVDDLAKVKEKGKLVVGITDFEPMDYKDADGKWIGFDADMANEFAKSLGVEAEFVEIE